MVDVLPIFERLPAGESIPLRILESVGLVSPAGQELVRCALHYPRLSWALMALLTRGAKFMEEPEDAPEEVPQHGSTDNFQKKIEPWADIVLDESLSR